MSSRSASSSARQVRQVCFRSSSGSKTLSIDSHLEQIKRGHECRRKSFALTSRFLLYTMQHHIPALPCEWEWLMRDEKKWCKPEEIDVRWSRPRVDSFFDFARILSIIWKLCRIQHHCRKTWPIPPPLLRPPQLLFTYLAAKYACFLEAPKSSFFCHIEWGCVNRVFKLTAMMSAYFPGECSILKIIEPSISSDARRYQKLAGVTFPLFAVFLAASITKTSHVNWVPNNSAEAGTALGIWLQEIILDSHPTLAARSRKLTVKSKIRAHSSS